LLRRIFGDDIAELATKANKARVSPVAKISPAAEARIEAARKAGETGIARQEERAAAQLDHANEITKQARLDPTNKRLPAVAEQAKQRALDAQNRADALLVRQTQTLLGLPDDAAAALAQRTAVGGRVSALRAAEAAKAAGTATPDQEILLRARDLMGRKLAVLPQLQDAQMTSLDLWLQKNRAILDTIGETTHRRMRAIAARVTGDLADSWLTTLYHHRLIIADQLESSGWDPRLAARAADALAASEVQRRYPKGAPQRILDEIAKTRMGVVGSELTTDVLRGAATYSQEWKNLAFGPADLGVFGQQVLKAWNTSGGTFMAGLVNNVLNTMHMGIDTRLIDDIAISKWVQYQGDGVAQGAKTGIVVNARRGILGRLGTEQRNVGRVVDAISDWQFGTVLGGMRNLIHEGNLVALHLGGQDITNPAVRAQAAAFANSATSYAPMALRESRALAERALLMTPSMRRAQVASILQMARVFHPKATRSERLLGTLTILNLTAATLVTGKLLNDAIGVDEFEMDPSKPGFGYITTKSVDSDGNHVVIQIFPQQQVVNTILKSVRELANHEPEAAAREWGKLLMGTSSPAAQLPQKAGGFGYQPGKGYRFGDLQGRLLNVLPLPPVFQSYIQDELTPQSFPPEYLGMTTFAERGSAAVARGEYGNLRGADQLAAINEFGRGQGWRLVTQSHGAPEGLSEFESYYDWRDAKRDALRPHLAAQAAEHHAIAVAERNATDMAKYAPNMVESAVERMVNRDPVKKAYDNARKHLEDAWVQENPQLTLDLYKKWENMGYLEQLDNTDWHFSQEQRTLANETLARQATLPAGVTPVPVNSPRPQNGATEGVTGAGTRPFAPPWLPRERGVGEVEFEDGSFGKIPPGSRTMRPRNYKLEGNPRGVLELFGQVSQSIGTLDAGRYGDTGRPPTRNLVKEFKNVVRRTISLTPAAETLLERTDWTREDQKDDNWGGRAWPQAPGINPKIDMKRSTFGTQELNDMTGHEFTHVAQDAYVHDLDPFFTVLDGMKWKYANMNETKYPQLHAFAIGGQPRGIGSPPHTAGE
ncbi:MAG TPA: hypothetical protein VMW48_01160, partial [Vicinamibacterales bacterium]|nr:hypothetical protein [Vicinamibacterales bacterium]